MPRISPNQSSLGAQSGSAPASGILTTGNGTSIITQGELGVTYRSLHINWTGDQTLTILFLVQTGVPGGAANAATQLMSLAIAAGNGTAQTVVLTAAGLTQTSGAAAALTGTAGHLTAPFSSMTIYAKAGGVPTTGTLFFDYMAN